MGAPTAAAAARQPAATTAAVATVTAAAAKPAAAPAAAATAAGTAAALPWPTMALLHSAALPQTQIGTCKGHVANIVRVMHSKAELCC